MERDRVRERERQGVSKGRDGGEDATDCVLGMYHVLLSVLLHTHRQSGRLVTAITTVSFPASVSLA